MSIRTTNSGASSSTTMYIGNQSITTSSDERLKKDIVDSQFSAVDAINNIEIKDFSWDDPTDTSWNNRNARGLWTGFIAQQAIAHIPFMINAPRKEDTLEIDMESEAKWSVDTGAAIGVLMKAIQEHKTEKDTEIAELRARIEALEL